MDALQKEWNGVTAALNSDKPLDSQWVTGLAARYLKEGYHFSSKQHASTSRVLKPLFYGGVACLFVTLGRLIGTRFTDNRWIVISAKRAAGYGIPSALLAGATYGISWAGQRQVDRSLTDARKKFVEETKGLRERFKEESLDADLIEPLVGKHQLFTRAWADALKGEIDAE